MKRIILMVTVALVMALMMALAGTASATIHPIVESADCANEQAFAHHPYGDPAEALTGHYRNAWGEPRFADVALGSLLAGTSIKHI